MSETSPGPTPARYSDCRPGGLRSELRLAGATLAWAICFVGVTWALESERFGNGADAGIGAWLLALVPTALAVWVVLDYGRFLRQADELQRLVQLRALAFCLGITWIGMAGYPLLEKLGAPASSPADYVVVMAVAYSFGSLWAWRQFR